MSSKHASFEYPDEAGYPDGMGYLDEGTAHEQAVSGADTNEAAPVDEPG